ncbi:MAG TPA: stage II sporulation protein M [Bacilli bacterium]|nr:stage II sporulation protein M [Bacilli bacterium]
MRSAFGVLQANGRYLAAAFAVFLLGWVLGAVFTEELQSLLQASLDKLEGLADKIGEDAGPWRISELIFLNNLQAALAMLLFGIPLCFPTVFMLLSNGMVVGAVVNSTGAGTSFWETMLFGLLPHGIFELPALFIAAAFGLKLGKVLIVPLPDKTRLQSFGFVWKEILKVSWLVVLLLVVAAGVEGTITPVLLDTFVVK